MDLDLGILAAVLGPQAADEDRWNRLSTLVRPVAPGVWRFGHDLFRQTIYEAVSYRRRREIHGRIGGLIETFAEGDERAGLLATHFDLAEAHDKAWTYAVVAGDRANRLYANMEATHFYRLALGRRRRRLTGTYCCTSSAAYNIGGTVGVIQPNDGGFWRRRCRVVQAGFPGPPRAGPVPGSRPSTRGQLQQQQPQHTHQSRRPLL